MRILWLALLALSGCGAKDPCDGESGICIGATVQGNVSGLDQLRITIDKPVVRTVTTPNPPSGFSLPIKVALVLPAGATGAISITIEGLSGGQPVASSGPVVVTVPAQRSTFTFTLTGSGALPDLAPPDLAMPPPDLVPPGVVAMPSTLTFPNTPRGVKSSTQKMTITNFGDTAVNAVSFVDTGDMGFDIDVSTSTCMMSLNLAPQQSCVLNWLFAPTKSGALMKTTEATLSTGQKLTLTVSGTATPAWTRESVPGPLPNLFAVHGSSSGDVWAVGFHSATVAAAYHTTGNGNWDGMPSGFAGSESKLNSVFVVSPTEVYAGGASIYRGDSTRVTGTWALEYGPVMGSVNALWGSAGEMFATGQQFNAPLFLYRPTTGTWVIEGADPGDGGVLTSSVMHALTGFTPTSVAALGTGGNIYARIVSGTTGTWRFTNQIGTGILRGGWSQPSTTNSWLVDDGAKIYSIANNILSPESSGVTMPLHAVHGRGLGGNTEIFAVGELGNVILRSTGNGTWTPQTLPTNQAMNGVYAPPDGHVYAVGYDGQIAHYF